MAKISFFKSNPVLLVVWWCFRWRAVSSSGSGVRCWECTSPHSRLKSHASRPSSDRSHRRWTWWSRTSWTYGSEGKGKNNVNSELQWLTIWKWVRPLRNIMVCLSGPLKHSAPPSWVLTQTKELLSAAFAHRKRTDSTTGRLNKLQSWVMTPLGMHVESADILSMIQDISIGPHNWPL